MDFELIQSSCSSSFDSRGVRGRSSSACGVHNPYGVHRVYCERDGASRERSGETSGETQETTRETGTPQSLQKTWFMETEAQNELVAQFVAFTGAEDTSKALQMLEATNFDIQSAVELYFAAEQGGGVGGFGGPGSAGGAGDGPTSIQGLGNPSFEAEEEVRAPIPAKIDRLMGDAGEFDYDHGRERRRWARDRDRGAGQSHQPIMDAFRARREEGMIAGGNQQQDDSHWASAFEPPKDIVFSSGDCEDAAMEAREGKKWLIVNIQSPSSFDSHRLNRDTWKDGSVQALLPVSFVLYQTYDVAEEGQQLASGYGVTEFPVIIVVDPVTGAPMKKWTGFIPAAELVEELVPFMDTSFDDPRASRLAASSFRKKHGARAGSGTVPPAEQPLPRHSAPSPAAAPVAAVAEAQTQPTEAPPPEDKGEEDAVSAQARALASLPDEPTAQETSCRVAVRLPDGTRAQRKFAADSPVRTLRAWCASLSLDAATGRAFVITQAIPGAPPLDLDADTTLGEAGVADCMLSMRWDP